MATSSVTNADFATRMRVLKQLSKENGIYLPQTIVPEGESLIPFGEERKRALRDEMYSLPTIAEASAIIRGVRVEQDPVDINVPLQRIRMNPKNGGIYGLGSDPEASIGYSHVAFSQASAEIKPESVKAGFAGTLTALPPHIRAEAFNYFAERHPVQRDVVLRTMKVPQFSGGQLELRRSLAAVVSERYAVVEDYNLMSEIDKALPVGARVRYSLTDSRSDLEIFWPAMSRELKVGDIANICLHVSNSQTKQCSIRMVPKILRVLCLNFTTAWGEGADEEITITHVGEARAKFARAIRNALAVIEPFIVAFSDAYQDKLQAPRGEVIGKVVKAFDLPVKFGELIAGAWDMDGAMSAGDNRAGLVNAMTRASQQLPIEKAMPIEAAAGRIIRQGWDALAA